MKRWEKQYPHWQTELSLLKAETENTYNAEEQKRIALLEGRCFLIEKIRELNNSIENSVKCLEQEKDISMKELWQEEINLINQEINNKENEIIEKMIPTTKESLIMEIRAGSGGQEASLFAWELANMYMKLCKQKKWEFKTFSTSFSEADGLKEGVFEITGTAVNSWLKSEAGVHCVKRVPKTEKKGRIHTSTATVAILKEPEDIEIKLNEKDLKIDTFRSSGPGGQSVNTTDSAIRITHIPTGIVVSQQDEKSQHKNKEKALKVLKARIYQKEQQESHEKLAQERRESIGTGQRNERIRTYHFTQNWVNDSRLEKENMCYNIQGFMDGDILEKFLDLLVWEGLE